MENRNYNNYKTFWIPGQARNDNGLDNSPVFAIIKPQLNFPTPF
jgi:hypothetical protein